MLQNHARVIHRVQVEVHSELRGARALQLGRNAPNDPILRMVVSPMSLHSGCTVIATAYHCLHTSITFVQRKVESGLAESWSAYSVKMRDEGVAGGFEEEHLVVEDAHSRVEQGSLLFRASNLA
jgi:hypothetical protein